MSFRKYIPYFVNDVPDENCAKAGRAAYFDVSQRLLKTIFFLHFDKLLDGEFLQSQKRSLFNF